MRRLESARLRELRDQISGYRRGRHRRARLPAALWSEATQWAEELGPYQASRALGVSYESLQRRILAGGMKGPAPSFVELKGAQLLGDGGGDIVELADGTGLRLTIRLAGSRVDVASVVAAFRGVGR